MVGGKKLAETATNSAMWEKPDVHAGLAAHQTKIRPFFDDLRRTNFTSAESCLEHIQASHQTNFIRLAADTKSLPNEVRDVYDKVADKIRSDSVKDLSINTLAKAAKYSLELRSVFEHGSKPLTRSKISEISQWQKCSSELKISNPRISCS